MFLRLSASFILLSLLLAGVSRADITDILDNEIPQQKMVMGKAGLGDVAPEPAPVKKQSNVVPEVQTAKQGDKLVARLSFPASLVFDWSAKVLRDTLSYSGRHVVREQSMVAGYYSASAWPIMHKALFTDADSPLAEVLNQHVDSHAVLLDMPVLLHTEQWQDLTVWVIRVPVMLAVYTKQPKKMIFDALLAVSVDGGTLEQPRFVVQKALLQKKDKAREQ